MEKHKYLPNVWKVPMGLLETRPNQRLQSAETQTILALLPDLPPNSGGAISQIGGSTELTTQITGMGAMRQRVCGTWSDCRAQQKPLCCAEMHVSWIMRTTPHTFFASAAEEPHSRRA